MRWEVGHRRDGMGKLQLYRFSCGWIPRSMTGFFSFIAVERTRRCLSSVRLRQTVGCSVRFRYRITSVRNLMLSELIMQQTG